MDTLALLCNLYGDGPQTLRRLREAGCGTLAALDTLESERLASLLRTSVRSAKRFQAEGRLLRERSEPSQERAPTRAAPELPAPVPAPAQRTDPIVANVLTAWRERDDEAQRDAAPPPATTVAARSARSPQSAPQSLSLRALGADDALLERLRGAGIETPASLCGADVLDLAGRGVGGYTRLLHLQFLARRATASPLVEGDGEGAPDLLVPARPPERRGAGARLSGAPAAAQDSVRFSPRAAPAPSAPAPLEPELQRFAARGSEATASGPLEDAGSSGPFA